jgi:hypothetical protein
VSLLSPKGGGTGGSRGDSRAVIRRLAEVESNHFFSAVTLSFVRNSELI